MHFLWVGRDITRMEVRQVRITAKRWEFKTGRKEVSRDASALGPQPSALFSHLTLGPEKSSAWSIPSIDLKKDFFSNFYDSPFGVAAGWLISKVAKGFISRGYPRQWQYARKHGVVELERVGWERVYFEVQVPSAQVQGRAGLRAEDHFSYGLIAHLL